MNDNYNNDDAGSSKRTLLAVVLSIAFVLAVSLIQTFFFSPPAKTTSAPEKTTTTLESPQETVPSATADLSTAVAPTGLQLPTEYADLQKQTVTMETDLLTAVFTNEGGRLMSLRLKKHTAKDIPVEMILKTDTDYGFGAMFVGTAGKDSKPLEDLMRVEQSGNVVEFSRVYFGTGTQGEPVPYVMKKRFEFVPGEYLLKLSIIYENSKPQALNVGDGTNAYSLYFGPQIGPDFVELTNYSDFRRIIVFENNKRKVINTKNGTITQNNRFTWAGIAGKYFSLVVIPDATQYGLQMTNIQKKGTKAVTSFSMLRPSIKSSAQTDTFYLYIGPKTYKELARYDDANKNFFNRSADKLTMVMEGNNALGWLENGLKWLLNFFYGIIPNYGIAIILLTILVRIILVPLTIKSSKSTAKMQELQPKIQELQAKYKSNPQKLNVELAELYKKEGANPLSGCLPVLLQFPIFIAMYSLFSNHFDLRGASFIAGWINDLSQPEAIVSFDTINLVIWKISAIRALPIIYVLSQLWYGKFMQQPTSAGQNQGQMNFMLYGLPIIFFFVLYDAPSGLLVYWIVANILTVIQQYFINRFIHKKNLPQTAVAKKAK